MLVRAGALWYFWPMALIACPGCARHVRRTETSCPFCELALDLSAAPERPVPRSRLSRSAALAFGAALSTQLAGCPAGPERDAGHPDASDQGDSPSPGEPDAPAENDAGPEDGGVAPLYGGPPDAPAENDAGFDAGVGPMPLYGGSPA